MLLIGMTDVHLGPSNYFQESAICQNLGWKSRGAFADAKQTYISNSPAYAQRQRVLIWTPASHTIINVRASDASSHDQDQPKLPSCSQKRIIRFSTHMKAQKRPCESRNASELLNQFTRQRHKVTASSTHVQQPY
jgi:hypothetical protein